MADRSELLNRVQYYAMRFVYMTLHCYPVSGVLKTAQLLGNLMYFFDRRHRERSHHLWLDRRCCHRCFEY